MKGEQKNYSRQNDEFIEKIHTRLLALPLS